MKNLGYYDGKFDLIENMNVPMTDRAFYFGDGVYEAVFCRNHKIFALDEHIERLYRSASLLDIKIPMNKEEMVALLYEMLAKVDGNEHFLYWQVSRGAALRNHSFGELDGKIAIMIKQMEMPDTYHKVKLISAEDTRFLHCNIKTLNLIPSIVAAQKAEAAGAAECIFHRGDRVTECSHSNVSILKDGKFITAPADNLILAGVARAHLIAACGALGIPVEERPYTMDELKAADEVIVSSTSKLCLAGYELDGESIGGKAPELLRSLQDYVVNEYYEKTAL
jgi:D-alanine transaminase